MSRERSETLPKGQVCKSGGEKMLKTMQVIPLFLFGTLKKEIKSYFRGIKKFHCWAALIFQKKVTLQRQSNMCSACVSGFLSE